MAEKDCILCMFPDLRDFNLGPFFTFLSQVVVHDLKLGTVQTFSCSCELAGYENEVTLPPI